jgi:hypothetical protein
MNDKLEINDCAGSLGRETNNGKSNERMSFELGPSEREQISTVASPPSSSESSLEESSSSEFTESWLDGNESCN